MSTRVETWNSFIQKLENEEKPRTEEDVLKWDEEILKGAAKKRGFEHEELGDLITVYREKRGVTSEIAEAGRLLLLPVVKYDDPLSVRPLENFLQNYSLLNAIHWNPQKPVVLAYSHATGCKVVCKFTLPQHYAEAHLQLARKEATILQKLASSNDQRAQFILPINDFKEFPSINAAVLVVPFIPSHKLNVSTFPRTVQKCLKQLLEAVAYIHECGIIHMDIKPSNILFDSINEKIMLIDFGHAIIEDAEMSGGTFPYISPEALTGAKIGPATDMWSIGVVFAEWLFGYPPFVGSKDVQLYFNIMDFDACESKLEFLCKDDKQLNSVSKSAKNLLLQFLVVDPTQRITAVEALKHKYLCFATKEKAAKNASFHE